MQAGSKAVQTLFFVGMLQGFATFWSPKTIDRGCYGIAHGVPTMHRCALPCGNGSLSIGDGMLLVRSVSTETRSRLLIVPWKHFHFGGEGEGRGCCLSLGLSLALAGCEMNRRSLVIRIHLSIPTHTPTTPPNWQMALTLATDTMRMHSELFNQAKEALEVRCRKCTLRIRFGRHLDLTFWSLALRQVSSHLHQATFLWGRLCSRPWVLSTPGGTPGGPGCTCWGAVRGTAFLGGYAEAEKAHLQAEPAPRWP